MIVLVTIVGFRSKCNLKVLSTYKSCRFDKNLKNVRLKPIEIDSSDNKPIVT